MQAAALGGLIGAGLERPLLCVVDDAHWRDPGSVQALLSAARHQEVSLLVAAGATTRKVADALFVSPKTGVAHLTRMFEKLGVRSRTELARVFK